MAVDRILLDHIEDPGVLFVFPTDIAVNRWADRLLRLRGGGSLEMERFTAWDRFKRESIRSLMQDRRAVPPVLRKIFAGRLLEENAAAVRNHGEAGALFKFLIPPRYAEDGSSFGSWLSLVLPQLGSWIRGAAGKEAAEIRAEDSQNPAFDPEDRDLFFLTLRYREFLEQRRLFEPAWERPPFDGQGRQCFIFFPEALSDFSEYRGLLEAAPQVRILWLPEIGEGKAGRNFFYTNARSEITGAALYIRNLVENEGVPWENIVVSLPDDENYEPYVMREFANRGIPALRRVGKALSDYPAGRLFTGIQDCRAQGFSFEGLSNLLLNSRLPWRDRETIEQLIDFGIRNNCLCSWTEEGKMEDVWLDAFRSLAGSREQRAAAYYRELKAALEKINGSRRFKDILWAYFAFRDRFLDISQCSPEADAVLSRCVSELLGLVEIEDSFPDLPAADPYGFFIEHLKETSYLPQERRRGVSVLPYRTAACAPFDRHIVLGASQDNLSMVFLRLAFLPRTKKERLGLEDIDVSESFIRLHRLNSAGSAAFFCSAQGFAGFSVPHQHLNIEGEPRLRWGEGTTAPFAPDLFAREEESLAALREGAGKAPLELYQVQARGFRAWLERRELSASSPGSGSSGPELGELLRRKRGGEKVRVSASALEPYYFCSAFWLYERVLRLESRRTETALMAENITGSLYHAVLDRFFKSLVEQGGPLALPRAAEAGEAGALPPGYSRLLAAAVREVFDGLPLLPGERVPLSALTCRFLRAQERALRGQVEILLRALLGYFAGCRVVGSELNYQIEEQDYRLTGKVDLLLSDEREESETPGGIIVDFKLNSLPDRRACLGEGGLGNFQLPLYLTLTEESGGEPVRAALFFSILKTDAAVIFGRVRDSFSGKRKPGRQPVFREGEDGRFDAVMAEFRAKVRAYARDIGGGTPAAPNAGEEHCGACGYRRVCRTLYAVAGDRKPDWGRETLPAEEPEEAVLG
ncbi:MAG: PD-(D/E)XK nuclease family protein [Treponema sp.]|nr:PD-(D/E)XK nuclease family protein [Treponema sp.]